MRSCAALGAPGKIWPQPLVSHGLSLGGRELRAGTSGRSFSESFVTFLSVPGSWHPS